MTAFFGVGKTACCTRGMLFDLVLRCICLFVHNLQPDASLRAVAGECCQNGQNGDSGEVPPSGDEIGVPTFSRGLKFFVWAGGGNSYLAAKIYACAAHP